MTLKRSVRLEITSMRLESNGRLRSRQSQVKIAITAAPPTIVMTGKNSITVGINAKNSHTFDPPLGVTCEYDVDLDTCVEVTLAASDLANKGRTLGEATLRLWGDSTADHTGSLVLRDAKKPRVTVAFRVTYGDATGPWHPPGPETIVCCRTNEEGRSYITVGGGDAVRVEVCPVRPFPGDDWMTDRKRPYSLGGGVPNYEGAGKIRFNDPINVVPNPSVIPILDPEFVDHENAARIEVTYYHPAGLKFSEDDRRLVWSASGDGQVLFLTDGRFQEVGYGLKVWLFGTREGTVSLAVRYVSKGFETQVATYRALVRRIGRVYYRAHILFAVGDFLGDGSAVRIPMSEPADVSAHIAVANRLLRQAAIELVPDPKADAADLNPVEALTINTTQESAVFGLDVSDQAGLTRLIEGTDFEPAAWNTRPGVVNILYVHSLYPPSTMGIGCDIPPSRLAEELPIDELTDGLGPEERAESLSVHDGGTPSHSWRLPTGVPPDEPAKPQRITIIKEKGRSELASVIISDLPGWRTEEGTVEITEDAKFLINHRELAELDRYEDFAACLFAEWDGEFCERIAAQLEGDAPSSAVARWAKAKNLDVHDFKQGPEYVRTRLSRIRAQYRPDKGMRRAIRADARPDVEKILAAPSPAAQAESAPHGPEWTPERWNEARRQLVRQKGDNVIGPGGRDGHIRFGQILAHELGHVLNLRHRRNQRNPTEGGPDGANSPMCENLMTYGGSLVSHNIDIVQAWVMHHSPLVSYE